MIKVKFHYDSENGCLKMRISGHATYAPKGEDLICAAVSGLAITAAETARMLWDQGFLKRPPLVLLHDGNALVIVNPEADCVEMAAMAYWTIQAGIFALEQRYPEYVALESVLRL